MKNYVVGLLIALCGASANAQHRGLWQSADGIVYIQRFCEYGMQFMAASGQRHDYRAGVGVAVIQVYVPNPAGSKYPAVPMACTNDTASTKGSSW